MVNKQKVTATKFDLLFYEPWKVVAVAFGAGAAFMGAAIVIMTLAVLRLT